MRQEIELGEMERTNEQIQHDVGDDDVEGAEVDKGTGVVATVCLPVAMLVWRAEWRLYLHNESSTHTQQSTHSNRKATW